MELRPPRETRTDTLFPSPTLFRSRRLQPRGHLSPTREEADFLAFPWGGRKPKVSVADNLSCPAAGGSVPPSRPALTAQAFRDVEADGVDEAGLDLRRDRLPEIGKLAGKLALDLGPGQLALEGPQAAGAVGDDVRSDERRVGKECVRSVRSGWRASH